MHAARFCARVRRCWRNDIRPLLILGVVLFSIRSSLADWNDVPTGSMKPTILEGDRVYVNKLAYDLKVPFTTWHIAQWDNPQRGDIVVFYSPHDGTRMVKRVVGLPGDTIAMRDEQLFLNGQPMTYGPLDAKISDQLPEGERQQSTFASEQLSPGAHPIMLTPALPARRSFDAVRVPEGRYFMMGDNRDNSFDSRFFGTVERRLIVGRATAVVVSLDRSNYWSPRWQRFFTSLEH